MPHIKRPSQSSKKCDLLGCYPVTGFVTHVTARWVTPKVPYFQLLKGM